MSSTFNLLLVLYVCFVLSVFLLIGIGKIILGVFSFSFTNVLKPCCYLFFEALIGLILVTIVISVSTAGLKTINILFLVPILFFVVKRLYKKQKLFIYPIRLSNTRAHFIFYLWVVISMLFLLNAAYLLSSDFYFKLPSQDLFFYSRISASSALYGNENLLFSFNSPEFSGSNGTMLYHYFDTWFNTLYIKLGIGSSFNCLYFVTTPILITLLYLGIIAMWENLGMIKPWKLLTAFILLFTCGMSFTFFDCFVYMKNTIPAFTDSMPFSVYGRKLLSIGVFGLASANLFLQKQKHLALIFLIITTIVYSVGTFIGLMSSFGFLVIIPFLFRKRWPIHLRLDKETVIFIFIYFFSFFLFVLLTGGAISKHSFFENSLLVFNSPRLYFTQLKSAISVIFYAWLFIFFCYFVYFLLLWLNIFKIKPILIQLQLYIVVLGCALFFGTVGLMIFYLQLDARQFLTNLLPFLNVLCLLIVILVIENLINYKAKIVFVLLNIFVLLLIYFNTINYSILNQKYHLFEERYSSSFRTKARSLLNKIDKTSLIGYYISKDSLDYNFPLFSHWAFLHFWGYSNLIEIPKSSDQFDGALRKYNLSLRSDTMVRKTNFKDSKIKFLTGMRLTLIVTDTLQTWIPSSMIQSVYSDERTGESIYQLKHF